MTVRRDYQDDDFLLVVDASGHSASLSYTCRRLGEDRFIPNSEVTEAAIVDRMVAMASEEFTRSFDVDVGKDSYLEATLPKCCREAYQLHLRGQPRVSITLQRDEKKLKVIFGPPNFDRIYESIVRLELMKPFTRLGHRLRRPSSLPRAWLRPVRGGGAAPAGEGRGLRPRRAAVPCPVRALPGLASAPDGGACCWRFK